MEQTVFTVSDAIGLINQTLDYAYPSITIEGEVASFKVNQGKYVFFDIKDSQGSLGCFMMLFSLRVPIEDGMRVLVTATPKLTNWGKFSLTVRSVKPVGEGSLKKSFELLKAKLDKEGLFAAERKRSLPVMPQSVAVIASTQSAGYADFIKIVNDRWGGVSIQAAHVQVQGDSAPQQIVRAIEHFNRLAELPDVLVIIRGGGSADDLAAFNDEPLVRAVAASRVPVLTGIGHEVDTSLVDLAADFRASTPSNAAEILVPNKRELLTQAQSSVQGVRSRFVQAIDDYRRQTEDRLVQIVDRMAGEQSQLSDQLNSIRTLARQFNPETVLNRGYALLRGQVAAGQAIEIETKNAIINAEVKNVRQR